MADTSTFLEVIPGAAELLSELEEHPFSRPSQLEQKRTISTAASTRADMPAETDQLMEDFRRTMLAEFDKFQRQLNAALGQPSSSSTAAAGMTAVERHPDLRCSPCLAPQPLRRSNSLKAWKKDQLRKTVMQALPDPNEMSGQLSTGFLFDLHSFLEMSIATLICLNTVSIGLSTEFGNEYSLFVWVDLCFTLAFATEVLLGVYLKGVSLFLPCRAEAFGNVFNVALVDLDALHFILYICASESNVGSYTVIRILRLLRLTRMVNLLLGRTAVLTLLKIVDGLKDGMPAIGWSFVFLGGFVYMIAIICKRWLEESEEITQYFDTLSRSIITVFRCSFGDCNDKDGRPLYELIEQSYGSFSACFYMFFVFIITVGIFNVINATFVDTMSGATKVREQEAENRRLQDKELFAACSLLIIARMVGMFAGDGVHIHGISDDMNVSRMLRNPSARSAMSIRLKRELQSYVEAFEPLTTDQLEDLVKDPVVSRVLLELDIQQVDHHFLHDMLDPENDGSVPLENIIDGLGRLRGKARRGDVITVDLMVRDIQHMVHMILQVLQGGA